MTISMLGSPVSAPPRYATRRSPELLTFGPQVAQVSARLGQPFMPHQALISDVANEIVQDPETGLWVWRYPTVIVTTPRQAGKTTTLQATNAHRCMTMPDHRVWYTAQTGLAARDVWYEWETALGTAMPGRWSFRRSAGQETARWKANRSFIRAFPPTPQSLHSKQGDTIELDEVWALELQAGDSLIQATVPTQATRPHRQLWILSTAGDDSSVWWRSWVEKGRQAVDDPDSGIAYFEWSASDDMDVTDPDTWPLFHPAYGHTQDQAAMQAALEQMGPVEFARAFGNRWPAAKVSWRASWPSCATDEQLPASAPVVFAADSNPSHTHATIAAAGTLESGRHIGEVIDSRAGVHWLKPRLLELTRRHRAQVIVHRSGPLGYMIDELKAAGVHVIETTTADYSAAIARVITLTVSGSLGHADDPRLNVAVDNAVLRDTGDRQVLTRRDLAVDISPFVAFTWAVWHAAEPKRVASVTSRRPRGDTPT